MQSQTLTPTMRMLHDAHVERLTRIAARAVPDRGINLKQSAQLPDPPAHVVLPECRAWMAAEAAVWFMSAPKPQQRRPTATIPQIQRVICGHFGICKSDLIASSRDLRSRIPELVIPRQIACYLCCCLTKWSLSEIGRLMHRDHTTVIFARDQITIRRATNPIINRAIMAVCDSLALQGVDTSAVPSVHRSQPHAESPIEIVESPTIAVDIPDFTTYTYSHRIAMATVREPTT